jgi:hypothetical protein
MKKQSFIVRVLAVFVLLGVILAAYYFVARPYQLRMGATLEEIKQPMPGDELDPTPTFLATRAVTIAASPERIWPWLLQMGYTRAGYYGYDIMENIGSPRGMSSADRILPEFQHFVVGDKVPISAAAETVFYAIEPNSYLIWAGEKRNEPGGFTWALYPLDDNHTRLVSRIRWTHNSITQPGLFSLDLLTEFTDHLAVRKILQGVKGRVEGYNEPAVVTNIEFFVYLITVLIFFAGLILLLAQPFTRNRWLVGLAAGMGWLLTWYAPMPFWVGALLEAFIVFGMIKAFGKMSRMETPVTID